MITAEQVEVGINARLETITIEGVKIALMPDNETEATTLAQSFGCLLTSYLGDVKWELRANTIASSTQQFVVSVGSTTKRGEKGLYTMKNAAALLLHGHVVPGANQPLKVVRTRIGQTLNTVHWAEILVELKQL